LGVPALDNAILSPLTSQTLPPALAKIDTLWLNDLNTWISVGVSPIDDGSVIIRPIDLSDLGIAMQDVE
jgi:hypothetical protein